MAPRIRIEEVRIASDPTALFTEIVIKSSHVVFQLVSVRQVSGGEEFEEQLRRRVRLE